MYSFECLALRRVVDYRFGGHVKRRLKFLGVSKEQIINLVCEQFKLRHLYEHTYEHALHRNILKEVMTVADISNFVEAGISVTDGLVIEYP
jgi:hypothetical protein